MPFLKIHQYICDHDSFVTAKKVYNRYAGFSKECHTLMVLFREQIESYKEKIGKGKAESTYRGLVADYKSLLLFMKTKKNIEDIANAKVQWIRLAGTQKSRCSAGFPAQRSMRHR